MTPLTVVKVWLALVPRAVMAAMHTTMIKASMTAYSTAVGPSSALRKLTTDCFSAETMVLFLSGPKKVTCSLPACGRPCGNPWQEPAQYQDRQRLARPARQFVLRLVADIPREHRADRGRSKHAWVRSEATAGVDHFHSVTWRSFGTKD